jgi:hypothetical protein
VFLAFAGQARRRNEDHASDIVAPHGGADRNGYSPDRVDALVWVARGRGSKPVTHLEIDLHGMVAPSRGREVKGHQTALFRPWPYCFYQELAVIHSSRASGQDPRS